MRVLLLIIGLTSLVGCATRTKYQPMTKAGGYADQALGNGLYMSRFAGNAYTNKQDAQYFTNFRAVEVCREKGFKLARVHGFQDLSSSQTVQKTSNYNYQTPTTFTGNATTNTNYNVYGNTLNAKSNTNLYGQVSGGHSYGGSNTWNETYHYPTFDVAYSCENEVHLIGIQLKPIENSEVKQWTKDSLGAMQIEDFTPGSPNEDELQVGDTIVKVMGKRVVNVQQLGKQIKRAKDKSKISALIVREGKLKKVKLKAKDFTDQFVQGNNQVVQYSCTVPEIKKRAICSTSRAISSER